MPWTSPRSHPSWCVTVVWLRAEGRLCRRGTIIIIVGFLRHLISASLWPIRCTIVCVCRIVLSAVVTQRFTPFTSSFLDYNTKKVSVNYHKYTIYIVRIGADGCTLRDSAPCRDCHQTLRILGFRKIIYTTDTGLVTTRVQHIRHAKPSWGRHITNTGCRKERGS